MAALAEQRAAAGGDPVLVRLGVRSAVRLLALDAQDRAARFARAAPPPSRTAARRPSSRRSSSRRPAASARRTTSSACATRGVEHRVRARRVASVRTSPVSGFSTTTCLPARAPRSRAARADGSARRDRRRRRRDRRRRRSRRRARARSDARDANASARSTCADATATISTSMPCTRRQRVDVQARRRSRCRSSRRATCEVMSSARASVRARPCSARVARASDLDAESRSGRARASEPVLERRTVSVRSPSGPK